MPKIAEIVKLSADPAAGGTITYVADEDMVVHSLRCTLVTSAVAGNRTVTLTADDGTNIFWQAQSSFAHAASVTLAYVAAEGVFGATTSSLCSISLPATGLKLRKGDRLLLGANGLDAGDNFTAIVLQVERQ